MPEHAHATHQANVVDLHPRTKGKRVLYIANRADGVLQEELSKALQASRFKFVVIPANAPNRMRNMAASVAAGSFDAVLFLESFHSHAVYDALVAACQASPTPTVLVPVGRGRVAEVLRALSTVTMPPPRSPNAETGKQPRWTGGELARVEDLALEGKSDAEIVLALKNEFDVTRSEVSVKQTRIDCFGIVRGRKQKEGQRKLPQSYHDLRQAQRIREELHPVTAVEATAAVDKIEEVIARVDAVAVATPAPVVPPALRTTKFVPVTITGSQGTVLLESKRSLAEIVSFLIGES